MHVTCDKTALSDALSVCVHAVAAKSPIPALEGILFSVDKEKITLSGYNTQMSIQKNLPCDTIETGACVLSARIFFDIVRKLHGDQIEIQVDNDLNATIRCGKSVFDLKAESADEYPDLPQVNRSRGITLPCGLLRQMIGDTIFAISTNENKPVHTGSLFEIEGTDLRLISVDGYRLAVRHETVESFGGESFRFVVPGATLRELSRILPDSDEPVSVYPESKHGLFEFHETIMTTRLLEGEFLNYRTAVPADMPVRLTINKSELVDAVERVSLIISERLKNPVRCLFEEETLKLSCVTALGRSYDAVTIPFCSEKIEIGFNNRYLLDALKACPDEEVVLELKSGLSPCLLKPLEGDQFLYLVLPVRLKAEDL